MWDIRTGPERLPHSPAPDTPAARQEVLERRLEDGYRRIDQATLAGVDVSEWESFWVRLLGEYEDVCRQSDVAA